MKVCMQLSDFPRKPMLAQGPAPVSAKLYLCVVVRLARDCIANSIDHVEAGGVIHISRQIIATLNDGPHTTPINVPEHGMDFSASLQLEVSAYSGAWGCPGPVRSGLSEK